MKKAVVAVLAFVLLMMFAGVAPVMATQQKTTYPFAEVEIQVDPGIQWVSDTSILHGRGSVSMNYMYGLPWGDSITPGTVTGNSDFNIATLNGGGISKFVDSVPGGPIEGTTTWKLVGAGPITYAGISITSGPVQIAPGTQLGGLARARL